MFSNYFKFTRNHQIINSSRKKEIIKILKSISKQYKLQSVVVGAAYDNIFDSNLGFVIIKFYYRHKSIMMPPLQCPGKTRMLKVLRFIKSTKLDNLLYSVKIYDKGVLSIKFKYNKIMKTSYVIDDSFPHNDKQVVIKHGVKYFKYI